MNTPALRLALRVEGNYWNAYAADFDSMDGAHLLGSIAMAAAVQPEIKAAFMALMKQTFEALLPVPVSDWSEPRGAPENEKAGNA